MKRIDKAFWWIVVKWGALAAVVVGLWLVGIFNVLFILLLLFIQEVNLFLQWLAEPTKMGAAEYWSTYWPYWMAAYFGLFISFLLWYFLWYRRKRPYLEIGGGREGRVVWMKGVRRGLSYDVWDVKNYLAWKLKKNRLSKVPQAVHDTDTLIPRMWPDPLAIHVGRPTSRRIIYYSRPWRLKIHKLLIPNDVDLSSTWGKVTMPDGYIVNDPDPLFPGEVLQYLVHDRPDNREYERGRMAGDYMDLLDEVRDAVQASAAANPQLIHRDYEDGSYPVLSDEEVALVD